MQLNHSFTVPVGVDQAWHVLRDIERIGPCMPGATIDEVHEDTFSGRVKVKVGPMEVQYKGEARWSEVDEANRRATIEARGQETRSSGTASAMIRAELVGREGATDVTVITDLSITGKPAQFGRGVMSDVGEKLLASFAECLEEQLAAAPSESTAPESTDAPPRRAAATPPTVEPAFASMIHFDDDRGGKDSDAIDLVDLAGGPVAKRVLPIAGALALLWALVGLVRRMRR